MFNLWESIDKLFKAATEQIYPVLNNMDNLLYWLPFDPFQSFNGLYLMFGVLIAFLMILLGIVHILSNINRYSNKTTLKKWILIIVFLTMIIWLMLHVPWKQEYKTFDLSLIYYYWDKTTNNSWNTLEKWYKHLAKSSEYVNPFRDKSTNKESLHVNISEIFEGSDNLADLYTNVEELNYKSFLVWINWMYWNYSKIWITDGYISNLDLFWLNITESIEWWLSEDEKKEGIKNLPSEKTFTPTGFDNFINIIKYELTEDTNKTNITNIEWSIENPIRWKWDEYKFIWALKASEARIDILLESIEQEDNVFKYIVLPYYDFIAILTEWKQTLGISWLLDSWKVEDESDKVNISNEAKLIYAKIDKKIRKLSKTIYSDIKDDDETEYNKITKYTSSATQIEWVDTSKLDYYIKYNKYIKHDDIYDTTKVVEDSIYRFKLLLKKLEVLENNYKKLDDYKKRNKNNKTYKYLKKLEWWESTVSKAKDDIYLEYQSYLSNTIAEWYIADVNLFYALNLNTVWYSLVEFKLLWHWDKYAQVKAQKSHISLLLSIIENWTNLLNNTELSLISILNSINILDTKVEVEIMNESDIILYTLYRFIQLKNDFAFDQAIEKTLLNAICENWEYSEKVKSLNSSLNLGLDNNTVDCTLNNWLWDITNKDNFKLLWYKLIELYKAQDLKEEVNLIPYFWLLKENNWDSSIFYNSFTNDENWDGGNYFMTEKINFWEYKFVSPLIYYKYLLNQKIDKIPWIFINLLDMKWKVYTEAWVFNMKIWSPNSWYAELDSVNWDKYANTLTLWVPFLHNFILWFLWILNQIFVLWIYVIVFSTYLILLKSE